MSVMQSVFCTGALEASYFDTKILNDHANYWREKCRKQVINIRHERSNRAACRDLHRQHDLKLKIFYHENALKAFWETYRTAVHDLHVVNILYNSRMT